MKPTQDQKDRLLVYQNVIIALCHESDMQTDTSANVQRVTLQELKTDNLIYLPEQRVAVFSAPLRGVGKQEDLATVFPRLLERFTPQQLFSFYLYQCQECDAADSSDWKRFCQKIYKLTVQPKTLVNVKGTLFTVTRKNGTVTIELHLTGYQVYGRVLHAYPGLQCGQGGWLSRVSVGSAAVKRVSWPEGMQPIKYVEKYERASQWPRQLVIRENA